MLTNQGPKPIAISIHAPMRGRRTAPRKRRDESYFNPRPHAGATIQIPGVSRQQLFQSTPPCGGDVINGAQNGQITHFNPRPHAGATFPSWAARSLISDFNPRPHAGATRSLSNNVQIFQFQSTPPCGGDCAKSFRAPDPRNFNPRPHAGATC